jgi:hypothetical protein
MPGLLFTPGKFFFVFILLVKMPNIRWFEIDRKQLLLINSFL